MSGFDKYTKIFYFICKIKKNNLCIDVLGQVMGYFPGEHGAIWTFWLDFGSPEGRRVWTCHAIDNQEEEESTYR